MKHDRLVKSVRVLPVLAGILIAAHGVVIYRMFTRMAWVAGGLVLLGLLTHTGFFGAVYAILRRRSRHQS